MLKRCVRPTQFILLQRIVKVKNTTHASIFFTCLSRATWKHDYARNTVCLNLVKSIERHRTAILRFFLFASKHSGNMANRCVTRGQRSRFCKLIEHVCGHVVLLFKNIKKKNKTGSRWFLVLYSLPSLHPDLQKIKINSIKIEINKVWRI